MVRSTRLQLSVLLAVFVAGTAMASSKAPELITTFDEWAIAFGKEPLDTARRPIFEANVAVIKAHNAKHDRGETTFRMGLNAYADLTPAEWKATLVGSSKSTDSSKAVAAANTVVLPLTNVTSVDWRTKGVVTPVKSEGSCGSCWAMSATQAIESAYAIATGALRSLSVQQVLECFLDCAAGGCGCNGGVPATAFKYALNNGGLDSEDDYKYTGVVLPCDKNESKRVVAKIDAVKSVPVFSDSQLLAAVAQQPISVGIAADNSWQFYNSGVYDNTTDDGAECDDQTCLNHAVLIVGYGTDKIGGDYWTVKNSWGTVWGESGYIRMKRNFSDAFGENVGLCGINVIPSYPTVSKGPPLPLPPLTPPHNSSHPYCNGCGYNCQYECESELGQKCGNQDQKHQCYCVPKGDPCP